MIDKRMSIIYNLKVIYTIPHVSRMVGDPGDKPVCIAEGTANSAMELRASGGIHHKNDRTVGSSKISHECTVCFQCVPLSNLLTM